MRVLFPIIFVVSLIVVGGTCFSDAAAGAGGAGAGVMANCFTEITFNSARDHADPFSDVELDVVFTAPDGRKVKVPAFWAGGKSWRVRYASPRVGMHSYRTECSDAADTGLHGLEGKVKIVAYAGKNPLYRHGPIQVARSKRHFEHADGTPFLWLGDTWWMGLCQRLKWPDEFKTLATDRHKKGFNVIQIVAGLYPDMGAFDERGANEAGFPWEKEYARIRPEYFDKADQRLLHLADEGFVPCIVAAWGYHLPWLGEKKMKQHVRYLAARYGALPVVWCVAGEVNLPYYLEKGFPHGGEKQTARWTEVIQYTRSVNGFGRPITVHPTGLPPLSGRALYPQPGLLDFDMLQTGHGDKGVLKPSIQALTTSYAAKPIMPVLNAEVCYEALLGKTPAAVPRLICWASLLSGACGHTYGANGIWQLNRPEKAYGASPHGGNYGTIPWTEAMKLPGATQMGLAKKLLEQYPWHQFEPHPEWAAWAASAAGPPVWGNWIWYPEGDPAKDAPVESRFFRKTIELAKAAKITSAVLRVTVDDEFTAYLNGKKLGTHANWKTGREFTGLEKLLQPGKNVLAIKGTNGKAPVAKNPAGLNACLEIAFEGGKQQTITSDATWLTAKIDAKGWEEIGFEETDWAKAAVVAAYGQGPWGKLESASEFLTPFASGIADSVRIIYAPLPKPLVIKNLPKAPAFSATYYNPLTGERSALGKVQADAHGNWQAGLPTAVTEDWVLVLEAAKGKP